MGDNTQEAFNHFISEAMVPPLDKSDALDAAALPSQSVPSTAEPVAHPSSTATAEGQKSATRPVTSDNDESQICASNIGSNGLPKRIAWKVNGINQSATGRGKRYPGVRRFLKQRSESANGGDDVVLQPLRRKRSLSDDSASSNASPSPKRCRLETNDVPSQQLDQGIEHDDARTDSSGSDAQSSSKYPCVETNDIPNEHPNQRSGHNESSSETPMPKRKRSSEEIDPEPEPSETESRPKKRVRAGRNSDKSEKRSHNQPNIQRDPLQGNRSGPQRYRLSTRQCARLSARQATHQSTRQSVCQSAPEKPAHVNPEPENETASARKRNRRDIGQTDLDSKSRDSKSPIEKRSKVNNKSEEQSAPKRKFQGAREPDKEKPFARKRKLHATEENNCFDHDFPSQKRLKARRDSDKKNAAPKPTPRTSGARDIAPKGSKSVALGPKSTNTKIAPATIITSKWVKPFETLKDRLDRKLPSSATSSKTSTTSNKTVTATTSEKDEKKPTTSAQTCLPSSTCSTAPRNKNPKKTDNTANNASGLSLKKRKGT